MKGKSKKDQVGLEQWISNHLESPDNAPILLRPHLIQVASARQPQEPNTSQIQQDSTQEITAPNKQIQTVVSHNKNTVKPPENKNIIQQGIKDGKFYKENRQAIFDAWQTRNRNRR